MPLRRKLRVFLCHASEDKAMVRKLYKKLSAESWLDLWLDEKKLLPGQDWDLEIEKAVESSDAVIVCLSSTSTSKEGYLQRELRKVLDISLEKMDGTVFVVPVRFDTCDVPRKLKDWQYIDYFPASQMATAYNTLRRSLQTRKKDLGI